MFKSTNLFQSLRFLPKIHDCYEKIKFCEDLAKMFKFFVLFVKMQECFFFELYVSFENYFQGVRT